MLALRWWLALVVAVGLPWGVTPVSAQTSQLPTGIGAASAEQDLGGALVDAAKVVGDALADVQSGGLAVATQRAIESRLDRIRADDLLIRARHADMQRLLDDRQVGGLASSRLADAAAAYREQFASLGAAIDEAALALGATDLPRLRTALDALGRELASRVSVPDRAPIGVSLPFRPLSLPPIQPAARPAIIPAYGDSRFREPVDADLQAAPEAPLDAEILAQARTLGQSPIALFEFVQNEVDIEFYHGSMKGARETLREKRGNDVDQAALLVALMRASQIPARYVRGVIVLTAAQAQAWTGVSGAGRAADVLTAAGIPFRTTVQGGTIASFEVEHTWVEVAVAYRNYRGAAITPGARTWIPLDPSFTYSTYSAATDVLGDMAFDGDTVVSDYLSALQSMSPLDFVKRRIADYLALGRPNLSYENVVGRRTIQRAPLGLLPNTLPYFVATVQEEVTAIPDALRHRIRFAARTDSATAFDITLAASDVIGKRVTLSYIADTIEDQNTIDSFLGLDNTPAYLVRLRPVLKVGGVLLAAGEESVPMGAMHDFSIEVRGPRAAVPIENSVMAGGYYAVAFGGTRVVLDQATTRADDDTEEGAADILYGIAASYLERWNQSEQELADILRLSVIRPIASEVMVGTVHRRTVLFGQPQEMVWRGVFVDADLRISEVVPVLSDEHRARRIDFRQLSALAGSMAESEVLEATLEVESVSAAKAIQLARTSAVPILDIDSGNAAVLLPTLATADIVKTEIADGVRQGWRATVPQHDIGHNIWNGIGYVLSDPADGSAGYFISGGLAGGTTSENPDDWVRSLFKDALGKPYAPKANTDPSAATTILAIPVTDGQTGVVGQSLPKPLAAWVIDSNGRPVAGATVTFKAIVGGGTFGSSDSMTSVTNSLGIATATPTLGTSTSLAPYYVLDHPSDTHVTQVGLNLISASVETRDGPRLTSSPFQALAHPDLPFSIFKVVGDNKVAVVGTKGSTMMARVEDRYSNPISNVEVAFSVLTQQVQPGVLPTLARNLQIIPLAPPCPNPAPVLGECGGRNALTITSSIFGAGVDPILGDTENTRFQVSAAVVDMPSVTPQVFTQFSSGIRDFRFTIYQRPAVITTLRQLVNDKGSLLNATKVGTTFKRPLETVVYVMEDNYVLDRVNDNCPAGPPGAPCYRITSLGTTRIRPVNNHQTGSVPFAAAAPNAVSADTSQEFATVGLTVTAGGGTTTPSIPTGHGGYSTILTVGAAPALNRVASVATAMVWVPFQNLYTGTVVPVLAVLQSGQKVTGFNETLLDPSGSGPLPLIQGTPQTLNHEVFGVRVTITPPGEFPISEFGTLTRDVPVAYTIEPLEYRALLADVDILEVDPSVDPDAAGCRCKWLGLSVSQQFPGGGISPLFRGLTFDRTKSYRLQAILNRGSDAQITSDKFNLAFLTGIATYSSYKALPPSPGFAGGLDFSTVDIKNVRGAQVFLLDAGGNIVSQTNTNENGFYSLKPPTVAGNFRVRIAAALGVADAHNLGGAAPHVIVVDNTNPTIITAPYATVCQVPWTPDTTVILDTYMKSDWNAQTQTFGPAVGPAVSVCPGDAPKNHPAAPFAILDSIYQAEKTLKRIDPTISFEVVKVYWSVNNIQTQVSNYPAGQLASTQYDSGNIYVLGSAANNADEYDAHVILHEWGHYFQDHYSRDDTPGGSHGLGDILDPRTAFSEGFGTAWSGMMLDPPDPVYVNTFFFNGSQVAQKIDVGTNTVAGAVMVTDGLNPSPCVVTGANPVPTACSWPLDGYYSEASVQETLWNLSQSLGVESIYRTVRAMETTEGFTTIFSFLHHLRQLKPTMVAAINTFAAIEGIPIGDEYGSPGVQLYTLVSILDPSVDEALRKIGINNVIAANGRPLQTWNGRRAFVAAAPKPDLDAALPDRWDPTVPPAQPQSPTDPARPTPCGDTTPAFCLPDNKLFDYVFLKFTIEVDGDYAIEVVPTAGTGKFDAGNLWMQIYSGPKKIQSPNIAATAPGIAILYVPNLVKGTYLLDVTSWGGSATFTIRIHQ